MSDVKLLTLCIPTYNRGIHLNEQLRRLSSMPPEMWKDLTVFVSDNCSNDNTEEIVRSYISKPIIDIVYSKNECNLGMDGNFVKCFTSAKSKYVWLLGDDDYIKIDKLVLIVKLLKENNCGVCHLGIHRKEIEEYTIYRDVDNYLREIAIWISFISSNIVNTKYVPKIDFEKYYGTFFTLIPLYLTAMIGENQNIMINTRIFEDSKDYSRNGGYSIVEVFVKNYLSIFDEFVKKGQLSHALYEYEKKCSFDFVIPLVVDFVLLKKASLYKKDNTWSILFAYYGIPRTIFGCARVLLKKVKAKFVYSVNRISSINGH